MHINYRYEAKTWAVFFLIILIAFFMHELGHCVVAWLNGLRAVPTPAKEYLLDNNASAGVTENISLGGIAGTALFSITAVILFITTHFALKSSVLAGGLATPGIYMVGFLLKGRGHDATEFQEAQSALGLSYSGHFLDWFFLALFLSGIIIWVVIKRPGYRVIPKLLVGFIAGLVFTIALQKVNNAIFDPIFSPKTTAAK